MIFITRLLNIDCSVSLKTEQCRDIASLEELEKTNGIDTRMIPLLIPFVFSWEKFNCFECTVRKRQKLIAVRLMRLLNRG